MTTTRRELSNAAYRMATKGGYVLAFAKRVAHEIPDLSWQEFRNVLSNNGTCGDAFCGYAEIVVRRSFGR